MNDMKNVNPEIVGCVILGMMATFLLGAIAGAFMNDDVRNTRAAALVGAEPVDPRIGEDLQELSRRTIQLADFEKKQQEQINELYGRDEQLKAFIENLYRSEPQTIPNSLQASK